METKEPKESQDTGSATAGPGKKLEMAIKAGMAARDFGAFMLRVVDLIGLKPKQQASKIVAVRAPNPNVFSFHELGADEVYKKIKEVAVAKNALPEEDARVVAQRIWQLAVEGIVDDPVLGYSVMGYTVAPTRDGITDPKYFRMFTNRNLTFFHLKTLNKKVHYRSERSDQRALRHTLLVDDKTMAFDYPEFDPRFIVQRWLNSVKFPGSPVDADADGDSDAEQNDAVMTDADTGAPVPVSASKSKSKSKPKTTSSDKNAPDDADANAEEKEKKSKRKSSKKDEDKSKSKSKRSADDQDTDKESLAHPILTTAEILLRKKQRVDAARAHMAQLVASNVIDVLEEKLFSLPELQRFGFFPVDFSVDVKGIFADVPAAPAPWETYPLLSAILVAANPDRFAPQGIHRFLASHSSQGVNALALRTDTQARVIDSWSRNSVGNTWDMATLATEVYASCKAVELLSEADSILFRKASALFAAADCADRVIRLDRHATVPEGGRTCALSGHTLPAGMAQVTTVDLQLRVFGPDQDPPLPKFVRLWIAPTVADWRPTDRDVSPEAPREERKRPRETDEHVPETDTVEPPKKKARKEKKKKDKNAELKEPVFKRVNEWSTFAVKVDDVFDTMMAVIVKHPPKPDAVDALRAILGGDKNDIRKWLSPYASDNFVTLDIIYRFIEPVDDATLATAPETNPRLSLLDDSDEDAAAVNGSKADRVPALAVPHAAAINVDAISLLYRAAVKERSIENTRSDGVPAFFEERVKTAKDAKKLGKSGYEFVAFAALFQGAQ